MSKTVPQLKKIERGDPEKVEQISQPYAWQQPAVKKPVPGTADLHVKTIPVGNPVRKRSR